MASSGSADLLTRTGRTFFFFFCGLAIFTPENNLKNNCAHGPYKTRARQIAMATPKMMSKKTQLTALGIKPKKLTPRYKAIMKAIVIGVEEIATAFFMISFLFSRDLSIFILYVLFEQPVTAILGGKS